MTRLTAKVATDFLNPCESMSTAEGSGRSRIRFQADGEVVGGSTVSDSEDAEESEEKINYLCCVCQRTHTDPLIFTKIYRFWLPKPGLDDWSCPLCTATIYNEWSLWGCHPGYWSTPVSDPHNPSSVAAASSDNACAAVSASEWLGPEHPQEGVPSQPTTETETIFGTDPETSTETETSCDNKEYKEKKP